MAAHRHASLLSLVFCGLLLAQSVGAQATAPSATPVAPPATRGGIPAQPAEKRRGTQVLTAGTAQPADAPAFDLRAMIARRQAGELMPNLNPQPRAADKATGPPQQPKIDRKQETDPAAITTSAGTLLAEVAADPAGNADLAGRPLPQAEPATTAGAIGQCRQAIENPALDGTTNWGLIDGVAIDTAAYSSAPNAFVMIDDKDDGTIAPYGDVDRFGQIITVPPDTGSLLFEFQIAYLASSLQNNTSDTLKYELWSVDNENGLVDLLAAGEPETYTDNGWHYVSDYVTRDTLPGVFAAIAQNGHRVAIVFSGYGDGLAPNRDVSIDDIYVTLCPQPGTISGQWTHSRNPAAPRTDALTLLTYVQQNADGSETVTPVDVVYPDASGRYSFANVTPLTPTADDDAYQIWYFNDGLDATRIGYWGTQRIGSFAAGENTAPVSLQIDISDIDYARPVAPNDPDNPNVARIPTHGQQATIPTRFDWSTFDDEWYELCIYNIEDPDREVCSVGFGDDTLEAPPRGIFLTDGDPEKNIPPNGTPDFFENAPNFFAYDRTYAWYVNIRLDDGTVASDEDVGASFGANEITFVRTIAAPPAPPIAETRALPAGSGTKDWTLMVYLAGDNDLGGSEPGIAPDSQLQAHFRDLARLAPRYPNINIVVLADFYDANGTRFCHMRPSGGPDCVQMGELDTASPATLTNFIRDARTNFPATRTMLIITDHGHALGGVAADDTNNPQNLTESISPDELQRALAAAAIGPDNKLDVLFFYTCLMGGLEVANDMSPYAHYMAAGVDTLWMLSMYPYLLPVFATPAASDPANVATAIVASYQTMTTARLPRAYASIAAYDLRKAPAVAAAMSALGSALQTGITSSAVGGAIDAIRIGNLPDGSDAVQVYDSSPPTGDPTTDFTHDPIADAFVDLRHLATRIDTSPDPLINPSMRAAARGVLAALGTIGAGGLVIASYQKTGDNGAGRQLGFANASGLFVFFPNGAGDGAQNTLRASYIGIGGTGGQYGSFNTGAWDDYVNDFASFSPVVARAPGRIARGPGRIARGPGRIARGIRPTAIVIAAPQESLLRYPVFVPRVSGGR